MKNRHIAITLAATAMLGISACGGETKPKPMDAITKMQARLKTYKTVELSISGTQDSKPMSMTFHGPVSGTATQGSITSGGDTAQIIQADGTTYVKASAAYLKKQGGSDIATAMLGDKWLKGGPATENFLKEIFNALAEKKPTGEANTLSASDTKVTSEKFNGQDAWKLTSKDGKNTVWLKKGTFDLLKATGSQFGPSSQNVQPEAITINKHDEAENIKAPAGAIDLSQFGK